ncbi:uncharacterized protein LOC101849461 [Aplysia californica]|uniref:Uncharacterized protein LOC101849461 n=1 Tax=Aplysia californica TaxID=6500 RepID=A0ABM0JQ27_APLCA|nr:uncharacterized protein LOC101849461 [Aplysia californica]
MEKACARSFLTLTALVFVGIPLSLCLTPKECDSARRACREQFNTTGATDPQTVCDLAYNVSQCLQADPSCLSFTEDRLLFLDAKQYMEQNNFTTCDLNRLLPEPTEDCEKGLFNCLKDYADQSMMSEASLEEAKSCQNLVAFFDCQRAVSQCDSGADFKANLTREFQEEELRIGADCIDPRIQPIVTRKECDQFTNQCNTLSPSANDTDFCNKTKESLECIVSGQCKSDVELRILEQTTTKGLIESNITCDVADIFASSATDTDCSKAKSICLNTYVDSQLEKENPTKDEKCENLNTFIVCRQQATVCHKETGEFQKIADVEQERMGIECTLKALNHGGKVGVSLFLLVTAVFTKFFFA